MVEYGRGAMLFCAALLLLLAPFIVSGTLSNPKFPQSHIESNQIDGRPTQWLDSSVQCDSDKQTAIDNAVSQVIVRCIFISGGQGSIEIWSEPDCVYNFGTGEWCCSIGGLCAW